ncbi:hypothetical protein BU25DRAFT_452729 [Macroventuria anomochaeta]|uniref:Uncharacterized protein n=1 Tax=Macroventuria anomochaeta TaxID=301207 RepID=A0ACB6RIG4_9PLEO|nr:uncharacterized protein BU25DRAFT_452729 [Macroventuria anomochaeta]KAF2621482.1 hypothetical protein BU25DRAFT_452729 [Macroventuria anomochaeta]
MASVPDGEDRVYHIEDGQDGTQRKKGEGLPRVACGRGRHFLLIPRPAAHYGATGRGSNSDSGIPAFCWIPAYGFLCRGVACDGLITTMLLRTGQIRGQRQKSRIRKPFRLLMTPQQRSIHQIHQSTNQIDLSDLIYNQVYMGRFDLKGLRDLAEGSLRIASILDYSQVWMPPTGDFVSCIPPSKYPQATGTRRGKIQAP